MNAVQEISPSVQNVTIRISDRSSLGKGAASIPTLRKWLGHRALVPTLFLLYVALKWVHPSNLFTFLLIWGVTLAARLWEIRGGVVAGSAAGLSLLFGLWRQEPDFAAAPLILESYVWTWAAIMLLGISVGSLTRHARATVRINDDLRQAQQRLAALHTIALSLSTTLDVNRLTEKILEQLGRLWGYDFGAILLLDDETGDLVVAEARGYVAGAGHRIAAGAGIVGAVVLAGAPICVGDVAQDPRYIEGIEGARSELAVPLVWEGKTLGILNVESRLPDAYGPSDVTLLSTVAEQAAASLGNARLHQQTRHLAMTDPHTGLYNYRYYQDQVTAMVRDSQISGVPFALIMLDIDHFKRVNDTYGHPTGDTVLEQVARVLRESCRQGDLSYRYGGEEFAITLPGTSPDVVLRVAERIREKIAGFPFITKSGRRLEFPMTVSVGVACFPRDGMTHVDLLLAADKALYSAKAAGRDRVVSGPQSPHSETA